jgi:hypothetical protein
MKKSRYTGQQIIGILKQHKAGVKTAGSVPGARDLGGDVLWLEVEVRTAWTCPRRSG